MARTGKKDMMHLEWKKLYPVLITQMLTLVGFQFLGIPSVYLLIALALGLFLFIYNFRKLTDYQRTDLGLMLTSMTIFTLFMGISPLYLESGSWLRNSLLSLGFSGVYLLGFFAVKYYRLTYASMFKPLLIGLAAFVGLNLLYTLYRYLPWYRLIYAGQVIYVDGEVYVVSEEVKWLIGLQFVEFKIAYMEFYLTLLMMPLLAHVHLLQKPKQLWSSWKQHLWWMFPSMISLLGVFFLPTLTPLWVTAILGCGWWLVLSLPTWWKQRPTLVKPIVIGVLSFFGVMVVLFFIDTYDGLGIGTWIKQIGPLERILDFPLIEGYQIVLRSMFENPFGGFAPIIINGQYRTTTYSMVFDTLHQGGIFAWIGLIIIGIFYFNQLVEFSKEKQIDPSLKMTIIFFVFAFILYQTFNTQLYPWVRELERTTPRLMFDEPLWIVIFFLMGTMMIDPFVGLLKLDSSSKVNATTITKQEGTKSIKKSPKGTKLRKGKSPSMFADHWKVVD
ncbi:MAG: hypothetical protein ACO207_00780 [Bacilli bacterium]